MLPASLVQQVVVKNTFLDFDDSGLNRSYRRHKTEGDIMKKSSVEYYDPNSDSDSISPASSSGRSSAANSGSTGTMSANDSNDVVSEGAQDQLELKPELRKPVMLLSEVLETSTWARAGTGITDKAPPAAPTIHHWTVDAKKLRSNDRSIVSRPFTLAVGGPGSDGITCKMMLYAKSLSQARAGQSFKLSGGQGSVQLKCENDLSGSMQGRVSLRFFMANGQESKVVHHNFSQSASCASQDWDFSKAVDKSTQTFVISVEVVTA
jgi:hypothetical protein